MQQYGWLSTLRSICDQVKCLVITVANMVMLIAKVVRKVIGGGAIFQRLLRTELGERKFFLILVYLHLIPELESLK